MPDFDTRKPREPNEPSRSRSALIANKHRMLLIIDRIRTLLPVNRVAPLLISGGIFLFVVLVVWLGLSIYAPRWLWLTTHDAPQEVPPYRADVLDSRDCPQYVGFEGTTCYSAYTDTRNRWALTLITNDIANKPQPYVSSMIEVTFFGSGDSSFTAGYSFEDDDVAEKVLSEEELRRATVIDGDYVFIGGLDLDQEY